MPENPEWLKAFGRVSVVHTHLDHILRMMIKTLANVTPDVALSATEGEGAALPKVQDVVERCRRVTVRRNELIHTTIASDWLGTEEEAMLYRAGLPHGPVDLYECRLVGPESGSDPTKWRTELSRPLVE